MKAVIFDLDGTLLDSMGIWRHAGEIYLRSFGIEAEPGMSDEILKLTIRGGAEYIIKRYGLPVMPEEAVPEIVKGSFMKAFHEKNNFFNIF